MRTIKFRGLRTDGNGWAYGDLRQINTPIGLFCWICVNEISDKVIPESVGQFIILKDIEGNELYIDDIVEFENGDRVVICQENWLEIYCKPIGEPECEDQWRDLYRIERGKRVGNIHLNPDLL